MIVRAWRGTTAAADAAAYQSLLLSEIVPGITGRGLAGYAGMAVLRRDTGEGVEFLTLMAFDSMAAVEAFAGPDPGQAVVPDAARRLLRAFDARSAHYRLCHIERMETDV